MKLTAKEYAHRFGLSPRTVRLHLAQGKLPGSKEIDATGVETWYVEVPDLANVAEEMVTNLGNNADQGWHSTGGGVPAFARGGNPWVLVERMYRENVELAGRYGFYQAENLQFKQQLQHAEMRLLELEAPKEPVSAAASGATMVATGAAPMEYQDRDLTCVDCGRVFLLMAGERAFYTKRGLVEPKRCSTCRAARRQQKKQARAEHIQTSILTDHAPTKMSNYPTSEPSGQDSGSHAVSEELKKQPEAERGSEASAPPATDNQEASSGRAFKRFWRWLTQPVQVV